MAFIFNDVTVEIDGITINNCRSEPEGSAPGAWNSGARVLGVHNAMLHGGGLAALCTSVMPAGRNFYGSNCVTN